jgi:hypothetical protein
MCPIGRIVQQLLSNFEFRKFIDPLRLSPQSVEIERLRSNPIGIVGLQCVEDSGIDVANISAFKDRAIPGFVAHRALVDKPCIELPTIGVEPDLVTALKRSKASASAAYYPRLRVELGNNGPVDLKYIAHTVLVFRSEVHQDGSVRKPLGPGMALFGMKS